MHSRVGIAWAVFVLVLPIGVSAQSVFSKWYPSSPTPPGIPGGKQLTQRTRCVRLMRRCRPLIQSAYGIREDRLVGGPRWVRISRFDVTAKAAQALPREQLRLMAQRLLEDRFGLALTKEQRRQEVYELRLARSDGRMGPDFRRAADDCLATAGSSPTDQPERPKAKISTGAFAIRGMVRHDGGFGEGVVTPTPDRSGRWTGLPGRWDFVLASTPPAPDASPAVDPTHTNLSTIFAAVEEQLGLNLERNPRGSVEYTVIAAARRRLKTEPDMLTRRRRFATRAGA